MIALCGIKALQLSRLQRSGKCVYACLERVVQARVNRQIRVGAVHGLWLCERAPGKYGLGSIDREFKKYPSKSKTYCQKGYDGREGHESSRRSIPRWKDTLEGGVLLMSVANEYWLCSGHGRSWHSQDLSNEPAGYCWHMRIRADSQSLSSQNDF